MSVHLAEQLSTHQEQLLRAEDGLARDVIQQLVDSGKDSLRYRPDFMTHEMGAAILRVLIDDGYTASLLDPIQREGYKGPRGIGINIQYTNNNNVIPFPNQ